MTAMPAKEPPHNFEAEQALIGAVLVNDGAYHQVEDIVVPDHFADPLHAKLWKMLATLIDRGQKPSAFTLKTYAEQDEDLKAAGGTAYLAKLHTASAFASSPPGLAREIRDAAMRRRLIGVAQNAVTNAYEPMPEDTAAVQIERLEQQLYTLASGADREGFSPFAASLAESVIQAEAAHKRGGKLSGVTTGLEALDRMLAGLHRSDLIILAGRPSMGKTALATNIAFSAAAALREEPDADGVMRTIEGAHVGFFSLEMSAEQLATRILAEQSGIPSHRVRAGELNGREFERFLEAAKRLESLPLMIDDTPALTVSNLRTRARRLKRQHGLDLLVIDYLQLLSPAERRRNGNRVEEVSEITRGLKALAKELDVPVLALSQLSREVEKRADKRPQLADLRESGSIEQDADVVMFVYREEYYLARSDQPIPLEKLNRADVLVEKQRHGPIGNVVLRFEAALTRFTDA